MTDGTDFPLWNFALSVYSAPGVGDELIDWQDRTGGDVCLLLALCFATRRGFQVTSRTARYLDAKVITWRREVILPLRAVRRALKGAGAEAIRQKVKEIELEAEKTQLRQLERLVADLPLVDGTVHDPVSAYAELLGQSDTTAVELPALFAALRNLTD